jgi:protein-L-isoaspartate(D-aspartate) O-methyltransferase
MPPFWSAAIVREVIKVKRSVDVELARKWFAEDIGEVAPVLRNYRIVEAFAKVPREQYLGEGPWGIHSRLSIGDIHRSASRSPHHVYHDVLIAIDEASGINNGLPSLWARVYDNLDIKEGSTVLQVGAGVGYYTAILAELVSSQGHVIAYEIEPDLAERARHNLRRYPNVEVICGDATKAESFPTVDSLTACAGVTHVPTRWLDSLKTDGQLVLPYTGVDQWGFLLHLKKGAACHPVKSLGPLGAYHCVGARSDKEAEAITLAIKSTAVGLPANATYHVGDPPSGSKGIWVKGDAYWICCGACSLPH